MEQPDTPSEISPQPITNTTTGLVLKPGRKKLRNRIILFASAGAGLLLLVFAIISVLWYSSQLAPVEPGSSQLVPVTIEPSTTPSEIATLLKTKGVIRNTQAFSIYTRLSKTQNNLQAGTYRLSPASSTPEIVEHLISGKVDTFNITFLPGATLAENRTVLIDAGYPVPQVDDALSATYTSPLFAGKPSDADLEGYIYGETYNVLSGSSVEDILDQVFEEYARVIEQNDFETQFKARGLNLYEGIILASIIQRESIAGDEPQIAQVFYSRLGMDMPLGSDVTYQYIADKMGVDRDTNLDSPYNTRRYPGLPPGPISVPGLRALKAVAAPAPGDYLYFLSGDDDVTYYARTLSEHEANIASHCAVKCSTL